MEFRKNLQRSRKANKLTQTDLARQLNLKPNTIGQYENGSRKPGHNILVRLATALNTTTDYLLTGQHPTLPKHIDARCAQIIDYLIGTDITEQQINLLHTVYQMFEK